MIISINLVDINQLSLTYQSVNGEIEALTDLNFSVQVGELISIIGPSGCGKSTLLSIMAGLTPATAGSITLAGEEVRGLSPKIGYMLQKDSLLDWRTIYHNTLLGLEIRGSLSKENKAYVEKLLKTYGLWEFKDKYPNQLSGGMRQRVALIRTLAQRPELLLLDESFSALDYQTRLKVSDDIFRILKSEKKTAVIVTHDISEGISMSDRVVLLTKRPGTVKRVFVTDFGDPTALIPPLKRREHDLFRTYFNEIWGALDVHV